MKSIHPRWLLMMAMVLTFSLTSAQATEWEELQTLRVTPDAIFELVVSSDGGKVAIGTCGERVTNSTANTPSNLCAQGEFQIRDTSTAEFVVEPTLAHEAFIGTLTFTPDNQILVTGAFDGTVRLWDANTGESLADPLDAGWLVVDVAVSPDGQYIAATTFYGDSNIRLWKLQDVLDGIAISETLLDPFAYLTNVLFTPNSSTLIFADCPNFDEETFECPGSRIHFYDLTTQQISETSYEHEGMEILGLAISQDGQWLAASNQEGKIWFWNTETGEQSSTSFVGNLGAVYSLTFGLDDTLLASASADTSVRIWDISGALSGERAISHLMASHIGGATSVSFSADGGILAAGGVDGVLRTWRRINH